MSIFALQTARAGSKSVPDKNILEVNGAPLFYHNIVECEKSSLVEKIFISTDCEFIKKFPMSNKVQIINRPKSLCKDLSSHKETMKHAILEIEKSVKKEVDLVLVLLGNSCGLREADITKAYQIMLENPSIDSVESVSKFNMFNPFRALTISDGYLETFLPEEEIDLYKKNDLINDKNSAGNIYFFNGSFWLTRRKNIFSSKGKMPYQWLGEKIYPYVQDVIMEVDDWWQLQFLKNKLTQER